MRFNSSIVASLLTIAGSAFAQTDGFDAMNKPTKGEVVNAGSTYDITWEYNSKYAGTVSIEYLAGASQGTLQVASPAIATGVENSAGAYSWAVPSTLGTEAVYGIKITLESDTSIFQYSFPFQIKASGGSSSVSSSSSSTATTSSSSSVTSASSSGSASSSASDSSSASKTSSSSGSITSTSSSSTTATIPPPSGNLSTTATARQTTLTSVFTPTGTTTGSSASATSTSLVTGAANRAAAGSFAIIGGALAAFLAL